MSIDTKELKRVIELQAGNKCQHCKVGRYQKLLNNNLICLNCGGEPLMNVNYGNRQSN